MPTYAQYPPYTGVQNVPYSDITSFETPVPVTHNHGSGNLPDWDKIMYGSELDQQWNFVLPDTMASV
jgi:hypothetical protein